MADALASTFAAKKHASRVVIAVVSSVSIGSGVTVSAHGKSGQQWNHLDEPT